MSTPASSIHSVQFYDNSKSLIDRLCGIIASALRQGDSMLLVITLKHRLQLIKALTQAEIQVREAAREGRFVMCDANETLRLFMHDDMPNRDRFITTIAPLIAASKAVATGAEKGLTVFGEMVAVLQEEGNIRGVHALEALWNEALPDRGFHLHCAYPRYGFAKDPDHLHMLDICKAHTHVV